MVVDIWSDVRCPFCYIGKHNIENALAQFEHKDNIEIVWHSYELDPNLKTDTGINTLDYFVKYKGVDINQAKQMLQAPIQYGAELGLKFDFENSVVANSFNAHRLIQFAQSKGLGNEIEEALFKAHFTDGVNIDDIEELVKLGVDTGLIANELKDVLNSEKFAQEVKQDIVRAQQIGVRGVPYFVFNNKYAVSGAQPVETFLGALEKSYGEILDEGNIQILGEGDSCDTDGNC